MGVIGQLPHTPDELPGHEVSSGEPPFDDRGPRADELPSLGPAGARSISLTPPAAPGTSGASAPSAASAPAGDEDAGT